MLGCHQSTEDGNYSQMMSYNADSYTGYVQAYEGNYDSESWAWGGQQQQQQWDSTYDQSYNEQSYNDQSYNDQSYNELTSYDQTYDPSYDQTYDTQGYQHSYDQSYEQVPYDYSGYDFPAQPVQQTQMVANMESWDASGRKPEANWDQSGPKMGAELLTEMRLAELKRLIDRDNEALAVKSGEDLNGHKGRPLYGGRGEDGVPNTSPLPSTSVTAPPWLQPSEPTSLSQGPSLSQTRPLPTTSANAAPWGGAPSEEAKPVPNTSPLPTTSVNAPPWVAHAQDGPALSSTSPLPTSSIHAPPWQGASGYLSPQTSQAGAEARELPRAAAPIEHGSSAAAPSLGKPYKVLATFKPVTQEYGEMPVTAGEEVFVSEEPKSGWIYAVKRGPAGSGVGEHGWLPANALGIDAAIPEDLPSNPANAQSQSRSSFPSKDGDHLSSRQGRSGPRTRAKREPEATQAAPATSSQKSEPTGWSNYDKAEEEPWHEHGNWWSKQRHLKASPNNKKVEEEPWHEHGNWWSRQRHLKDSPNPEGRGKEPAEGGKGGGYGKSSPPVRQQAERPARERPALQRTLDRLSKPVVAPKPASST